MNETSSESIIRVLDAYKDDGKGVLVFPFLKNSETFDYKTYYSNLTYTEMISYFKQLFIALSESHELGVMHLDMKPSNVIYQSENHSVRLIDWGVSEYYHPKRQYRSRVGTRWYRAPE